MTRRITLTVLTAALCAGLAAADTFKHRTTGETFTGFLTQKKNKGMTLVYSEKEKSFTPIPIAEYDVTRDDNGRRNSVVFIPIRYEESIISQDVARTIADTIIDASNKGPRYIILEIDCPGGRGDYMKIVTNAITETNNCPVIAYITGGDFGGAYSAAAPLALACEKIYIAGDAVMGSLAPIVGRATTAENVAEYQELFSSDALAGFASYVASLASKNNRPVNLAMALLDKSLEIEEVRGRDGNTDYIHKPTITATQTPVRTLSKIETRTITERDANGNVTSREITQMVLTLRAPDAVRTRLADKLVGSREELLADLKASDAQITYTRNIETAVRRYVAAKRNVDSALVQIDFLQQRADNLQAQLDRLDEQVRTSPSTVEQRTVDPGFYNRGGETWYRGGRGRDNRPGRRADSVVTQEPSIASGQLVDELAFTLTDLVRAYRRVTGLVKRDPGVLPTTVTPDTLQRNLDAAVAMQDNLIRRMRTMPVPPGQTGLR